VKTLVIGTTRWATEITRTPAFDNWFKDSKAQKEGVPYLLYHGTPHCFTAFREDKYQSNCDHGHFGSGIYLANEPDISSCYGPYVMTLVASIQNLLVWPYPYREHELFEDVKFPEDWYEKSRIKTRIMRDAGYDGCVGRNIVTGQCDWVVFDPVNVKSVWNTGTWEPSNPDIFQ
jgi:hypothetical protein